MSAQQTGDGVRMPFPAGDTSPFQRTSAVSAVARRLLAELTSGGFASGTRLPAERELAATLQVSRSTLREAMAALDLLGIIEIRPGSGSYLRQPSTELLSQALQWGLMLGEPGTQDLVEIREHLEVLAARLAADRADAAGLDRLGAIVARMRTAGSVETFVQADLDFHLEVAALAGNTVLADLLRGVRSLLLAWFDRTLRVEGTMAATLREHEAVHEAIRDGDPDRAERSMQALMDAADLRLAESLGSG
ncbi:FadR/GntR family transcriptional regulator [Nakamurella leprariae]|uniref:FadR family transcriptional regulator n=1 Tax=Nakamurella leprariae TaxID=2803911 RepID=A0A938YA50_9ACTN|nr:FadR/GntR family transcriptional regulator [Nakamurella leprariae]MBM9466009.1 FadR family transcriptional regulator [Nakamurella leprariae]